MMGAVTCNQLHEIDRAIDALLSQQCPGDFDSWWRLIGDAIAEGVPKGTIRTWSESGDNFDERAFEAQYRSLSNRPSTGRTGMLFKKARDAGWVDRNPGKRPSVEDIEARKKLAAETEAKAAAKRAERHAKAEAKVAKLLDGTAAPDSDLPQLGGKGVKAHGDLRFLPEFELHYIDDKTGEWRSHIEHDVVAVPIRTERNRITSLQLLFTSKNNPIGKNKYFLPGGRTAGGYFVLGKVEKTTKEVIISESYTTSATIFEAQEEHKESGAPSIPVMTAFGAGNLEAVAKGIREKLGDGVKIVIAGDNDQWKERNTGVEAAKAAARAVGGYVAIPPFEPKDKTGVDDQGRPTGPTDWNDWHLKNGLENVAFHIRKSIEAGPFVAEHGADEAAIDRAAGFAQIASEEGPAPEQPEVGDAPVAADASAEQTHEPVRQVGHDDLTDVTTELATSNSFDRLPFDADAPLPHTSAGGRPKATIENAAEVLRRMTATVRYNVIGKRVEMMIPGEVFGGDNVEEDSLARVESRCAQAGMPTGSLPRIVSYLARQNLYNPAATWILSRPWDGIDRLPDFYATVTPVEVKNLKDGRSLHQVLLMRWMLSAIAAAINPEGVSAQGVLVLQGEQYLGKTTWFKNLVPAETGLTQDGMTLRPDDKDSLKQACSFWLVELGELDATFRKSDISALKAFITRKNDVLRLPYARGESNFQRRTVFFGSVNPREFLHDQTGNRRYWVIECAGLNHAHSLDMQQVWAQVYAKHLDGESHFLTPEEHAALNDSNESFQVVEPIEERMQTKLAWDTPQEKWEWLTSTEVLIQTGIDKPTRDDTSKAGAALRKLNGNKGRRSNGKSLLLVPPPPPPPKRYADDWNQ